MINIGSGKFAANDDTSAAEKRKKLREALLNGSTVMISSGEIKDKKDVGTNEDTIEIPKGKLAAKSFYWYENDPDLFDAEKAAMKRLFPNFKLDKNDDGRLFWFGDLGNITGEGSRWYLQVIYDNNHPHNDNYGGSVKIYPVKPSLEELDEQLEDSIPHVLRDSEGNMYICTSRKEDFKIGNTVTTAASSLTWAAKWIAAFELWLSGDLADGEFRDHLV